MNDSRVYGTYRLEGAPKAQSHVGVCVVWLDGNSLVRPAHRHYTAQQRGVAGAHLLAISNVN